MSTISKENLESLKKLMAQQYGLGWFGPNGEIAGIVSGDMGWDHTSVTLVDLIQEAHEKADARGRASIPDIHSGKITASEGWHDYAELQNRLSNLIETCIEILDGTRDNDL